jgi:hypothetical protein
MGANIGGDIKSNTSVRPVAQVAAASFSKKGSGVDLQGKQSFVWHTLAGGTTGTPDSFSVNGKLQHSDVDSDLSYEDVVANPQNASVAITAITAVDTDRRVEIDARGLKRYVRPVYTVAFVAGTTPAVLLASTIVTGDSVIKPVSQS